MMNMKIEHETSFNALGSGIQMSIMKKYPDQSNKLLDNPRIKIIIELG